MLVAARLRHIASTKWGKRRYLVMETLELLREIVGTVRLQAETDHLIARFERSAIPLLRTGSGSWVGSGGPLR